MARNKTLLSNRNTKLYMRYKDMYEAKRIRYDDVVEKLSKEFDLAASTVHRIIMQVARQVKKPVKNYEG